MIQARLLFACGVALLLAAPASARVDDARWKQLRAQAQRQWAEKAFAKRRAALRLLGTADREEAVTRLLELLSDKAIAAPEARERDAVLRRRYDSSLAERDRLYRARRGRNWEEQEYERYTRLVRVIKRLTRDLARLEATLTEASILRHDVIRALARCTDSPARKQLYREGLASKSVARRRVAVQALWLAGVGAMLHTRFADPDATVASMAIRAAGQTPQKRSGEAIIPQLSHKDWRVRSAAIDTLGKLRCRAAIGSLVAALQQEQGRLAEDLHQALVRITGFAFGSSAKGWQVWYQTHKDRLDRVIKKQQAALRQGHSFGTISFYGIRTSSRRICFVIDVSGSMQLKAGPVDPRIAGADRRYPRRGTRFQVARYELQKAINLLPEPTRFNIVYFNSQVRIYGESGLLSCSKKDKQEVTNWLRYRLKTYGGTRMYDALARGLSQPVDTVYFLTDGKPTSGRLKDPAEILEEITLRNQQLGVKLHVIAIGQKVDLSFLRKLASRNRGTFVHTNK